MSSVSKPAPTVLVLPGIGNSGPQHWQSLWEAAQPNFRRVVQNGWDAPVCSSWVARLEADVAASGPNTVLLAHSLGCLMLAHWAAQTALPVRGAFLVAVPDPHGPAFPCEAVGFSPVPMATFHFPSLIVSSTNDPYGSAAHARASANAWGSRHLSAGAAGHINVESGHGEWPQGRAWFAAFLAGLE